MSTHDENKFEISDDQLNLFIDEQLDDEEMDVIQTVLLDDKVLRERVCQLRAVRELVAYAYNDAPRSRMDRRISVGDRWNKSSSFVASILLIMGALFGWFGHTFTDSQIGVASSEEVFDYYVNHIPANHTQRKIVIHVSTGDLLTLNKALDETEQLIKSYSKAGSSVSIDIITNKSGINLLRSGVTPYADRIKRMVNNENVQFFACSRSIAKATLKEGKTITMLPQAHVANTARELIPERIDKGWVYIKV